MNLTYEDILGNMKQAYYEKCQELADTGSEMGKRLEVLAGELFSLSCYADYVFKQAFVQTATGKALDHHGIMRGCTRKSACAARGELTFYISEALENELVIPKSTVCSVYKKPYLQFATIEEAVIPAGQTAVRVTAESLGKSEEYNVDEGTVTVMVNAPIGVLGVTNGKFSGGFGEETESAYRQRIINSYKIPSNGVNAQSVENAVINIENVTDCHVGYNADSSMLNIIVTTKSGVLSQEDTLDIIRSTAIADLFGIQRNIALAKAQGFNLTADIKIRTGFDAEKIRLEVTKRMTDLCSAERIGTNLSLNSITKELFGIDGLSDISIHSRDALGNIIYCESDRYLKPLELAVNCFG